MPSAATLSTMGPMISSALLQRMMSSCIFFAGAVEAGHLVVLARMGLHQPDAGEGLVHGDHEPAGLLLLLRAGLAHLAARRR